MRSIATCRSTSSRSNSWPAIWPLGPRSSSVCRNRQPSTPARWAWIAAALLFRLSPSSVDGVTYYVAKSGIIALTEALALELGFSLHRRSQGAIELDPLRAPVRALATAYVELFRGTPVLLQLFVLYYGLTRLVSFGPMPQRLASVQRCSRPEAPVQESEGDDQAERPGGEQKDERQRAEHHQL